MSLAFFLNFIRKILLTYILLHPLTTTSQTAKQLFKQARIAKDKGAFYEAEECLFLILKDKKKLEQKHLFAIYNQLGGIYNLLGKNSKARYFFHKALKLEKIKNPQSLSFLYTNMGNSYVYTGDYIKATACYEETINLASINHTKTRDYFQALDKAYNNIGLTYTLQHKLHLARNAIKESVKICEKYKLDDLDKSFINYANCLRRLNDFKQADTYYKKGVEHRIKTFGKDYYMLGSAYKSYGLLKVITGHYKEAKELYNKALNIYINSYGNKHPYTADMYEIIGDYHLELENVEEALDFYQKSLVANSSSFNSSDIYHNPKPDSVFSKLHLLSSLKKKAEALTLLYNQNQNQKLLNLSLETIDLSLKTIKSVRNEYLSQESKLFISENEKEFYLKGIDNMLLLYELTSKNAYLEKAYQYSRESKAVVLMSEINQQDALQKILPDSLYIQQLDIQQKIKSLKKLVVDEHQKKEPDENKISRWSSSSFQLNNEYERLFKYINKHYPSFEKINNKLKITPLKYLQDKLEDEEVLIEYSYSANQLYTFTLSKDKLSYHKQPLDSSFNKRLDKYRAVMSTGSSTISTVKDFNIYYQNLHELYEVLLGHVDLTKIKNIIIVPDEKLSYVAFDALVDKFEPYKAINYSKPSYLLYNYNISYAYSSILLQGQNLKQSSNYIHAFAPSYITDNTGLSRNTNGELKNAKIEIENALSYFPGKAYINQLANKENFYKALNKEGIFHLAMHAKSNEQNPEFSYLNFGTSEEVSSLLYNYEISNAKANASIAVLSTCNSGDGKVFSGEGVMSISRSFLLAGVPSVVHGLWKINDQTSSTIISSFYKNLAKGETKNEALRLAKIEYIEKADPEYIHPVYWSGLVLTGNRAPLVNGGYSMLFFVLSIISVIAAILWFLKYKNNKKHKMI